MSGPNAWGEQGMNRCCRSQIGRCGCWQYTESEPAMSGVAYANAAPGKGM
jgi:hypothetical protein